MTQDELNAQEDQSPTTSSEADTPETAPKNDEDKILVDKKSRYANLGKTKTLEKKFDEALSQISKLSDQVNRNSVDENAIKDLVADGFDEEEARKLVKVNQRLNRGSANFQREATQIQPDQERETFLVKHPEMYQYIDELDNLKKNAPSRKYESIARGFGYMEATEEPAKSFSTSGNRDSGPSGEIPKKMTEAQESAAAHKEFDDLKRKKGA